jgi:heterodisulfide reductase subunit A
MRKKIIIIGGGVAGMQAAVSLAQAGLHPVIVERGEKLGGKLLDRHNLFPSMTPAAQVVDTLTAQVADAGVEVRTGAEVAALKPTGGVVLTGGETIDGDAVVVASGFDVFDARAKEEYGYSLYDNVFTTVDIERMMNEGQVALKDGSTPHRIAIVHCVGSRDEKVNQRHCSRVCCITAVKQAMELHTLFPDAEIYNFYMDIRMFGPGYEELYQQAQQESGVNFIRGRVSEASSTIDGRIQIKAEDTLVGRPMKMTVDMLVLAVGMKAAQGFGLALAPSGFIAPADLFTGAVSTDVAGVFVAGTASAPKTVGESIAEGAMAAQRVVEYLKTR